MITDLVPAIQEESKDKDLEKARILIDYINMYHEDGPTINEIIKDLKGFTRHTEFVYLLLVGKLYLLDHDVYPFASTVEAGTVLRVKLVKQPKFKELPSGMFDKLMANPNASFEYNDKSKRVEYSMLGHTCRWIRDTGFEGSIKYCSKNYSLQELLIPFQYKEFFDARPSENLCTTIERNGEEYQIANVVVEQFTSGVEGRQKLRALEFANPNASVNDRRLFLSDADKADMQAKGESSGGGKTMIQINVLGSEQLDIQKAEVIDGD